MTVSAWDPQGSRPPQKRRAHLIANVTFAYRQPADDAPMTCSCGWKGCVAEWGRHRSQPSASVSRAPSELERFERLPKRMCVHGHALTPDNIVYTDSGRLRCATCRRDASVRQWQREKAARATA